MAVTAFTLEPPEVLHRDELLASSSQRRPDSCLETGIRVYKRSADPSCERTTSWPSTALRRWLA